MAAFRAFTTVFCALFLAMAISACSPGMFFGNNQDDGVANNKSYRKINTACSGLDLSSSEIDVPTFRKLLHCFNSNGALEAIERLANRLSDHQLQPIVDVGNKYVLNNKKTLYQLEKTQEELIARGTLDNTLAQLGTLLENEEFVSAAVALLKEGYFENGGSIFHARSADMRLLRAFEKLSEKVSAEKFGDALDVGLSLAGARAFQSLQTHFRGLSPAGRRLRDLTDGLLLFVQDNGDPHHVEVGRRLIDALVNGRLFDALDSAFGTTADELRVSVPRQASFLKVALADDGRIFDDMTSLFHYLHRPIHCLRGTDSHDGGGAEQVPDGDMHVVREIMRHGTDQAPYLLRHDLPLVLVTLNSFCDLPSQLGQYYGSMYDLASTNAMEPAAELIAAFFRADPGINESRPLAKLLVNILADTGSGAQEYPGGPPENTVGVKRLIPALAELTDRGAWEDALLLATSPSEAGREDLVSALRFLTDPIPDIGASIYDVMTDAVARATPEDLYNLVYSMRRFVDRDQPILLPALTGLRSAFYINDVHPAIDIAHDIMANARANEPFFTTLFLISDMPEFQASVKLVSDMSKDGRLKELISSVITLFHKFALQGKTDIHLTAEPAFVPKRRHDMTSADVVPYPIESVGPVPPVADACRSLDPRILMSDYEAPLFEPQLTNYLACIDSDHSHGGVVAAVDFLREQKTQAGKSFFDLQIDLIKSMRFEERELRYLGDVVIDDNKFSDLLKMLQGVPYWVTNNYQDSASGSAPGPVLKPLFDMVQPIIEKAEANLLDLERYGAVVLRRADIPHLIKFADQLWDQKPEPQSQPLEQHYDFPRIMRWVGNKECENLPYRGSPADVQRAELERALQIKSDYENAVTTWDLIDGHVHTGWTFDDFQRNLKDLFVKFGDPRQSDPGRNVLDAMMNVMKYFTSDVATPAQRRLWKPHMTRDDLRHFLTDRSDDYKLIQYVYPGEHMPRVRLVNSLDRLELVLLDADFYTVWALPGFLDPTHDPENGCKFGKNCNVGMKFLAQIGDAWGDEPRDLWPKEIQDKFPDPQHPPQTLAQAVNDLLLVSQLFSNIVGYPDLPNCRQTANPSDSPALQQEEISTPTTTTHLPDWLGSIIPSLDVPEIQRHLFNIHAVTSVLTENLPGSGTPTAGGMRVLRDLFFELYYSSPANARTATWDNAQQGWANNLSVVMRLVRMGLTRQAGRYLRGFDRDDPTLKDFFNSLIAGSSSPYVRQILDPLFSNQIDPDHKLVFNAIHEIFNVINAAEGHDLDAVHQKELAAATTPEDAARVREGWVKDDMRMRQMAYYTLASAGPLGIVDPVIITLGPILHQYADFLNTHVDKLEDLLRSERAAWLTRALYESPDVENKARFSDLLRDALGDPSRGLDLMAIVKAVVPPDPNATSAWSIFRHRADQLSADPNYQALHIDEISRKILQFFEEDSANPDANGAADKLLKYLADRLERGDLHELMRLAGNGSPDPQNPNVAVKDEFYRVFQTFATYCKPPAGGSMADTELGEFFDMVRHSLTEPGADSQSR